MPDPTSLSELTREQLYELVWSTPATKLKEKLGVSDVTIGKRCHKLGVPRPERGYWAKLRVGSAYKKPDLPPPPDDQFVERAKTPITSSSPLPAEGAALHSLAQQFLIALKRAPLSYDKQLVHLRECELPEADVSEAQALKVAQTFHIILSLVEERGVLFKKSRSSYNGGCFRKGNHNLHFKIEEQLVEKTDKTGRRVNSYSSWRQEDKVASGKLTFILNPERYNRDKEKKWTENEKISVETIAPQIAKEILCYYVELQEALAAEKIRREKAQIEWEIQRKKDEAAEAVREQQAKERKHANSLESAARGRQEDLLKAAEWWRIHRNVEDFILECEHRWATQASGQLTLEQKAWAAWSREVAKSLSPFETGYPNPINDAGFDPTSIPFGGPYPEQRKFPQPPTMPAIPAPVVVKQSHDEPINCPDPKPYPFWLKYQSR